MNVTYVKPTAGRSSTGEAGGTRLKKQLNLLLIIIWELEKPSHLIRKGLRTPEPESVLRTSTSDKSLGHLYERNDLASVKQTRRILFSAKVSEQEPFTQSRKGCKVAKGAKSQSSVLISSLRLCTLRVVA